MGLRCRRHTTQGVLSAAQCYSSGMRLLPILVVLAAAIAHAQAVRPAPATGPLIHQQPPSYPTQVHAPAGAGASHGGLAAPRPAPVPDSPNKRLLPPTKEPGLWAADGAPVGVGGPRLFDVEIPHIRNEHDLPVAGETEWCTKGLAKAADAAGWRERIENYSAEVRACMAATAYLRCAADHFRWVSTPETPGARRIGASVDMARATVNHARDLMTKDCRDVALSDEQKQAIQTIITHWMEMVRRER